MSTARCLWALAFFSTELLLAGPARAAGAGATEAGAGSAGCRLAVAEAELALAETRSLYLVLDLDAGVLATAVRGLRFDPIEVAAEFRVFGETDETSRPTLPLTLRVLPEALEPLEEGESPRRADEPPGEEPAGAGGGAGTGGEGVEGEGVEGEGVVAVPPVPPVPLEQGWWLVMRDELPSAGIAAGFGARLADGWRRLLGTAPAPPARQIVVALPAAAAVRLAHRLRPGVAVLVVGCGGG